MAQAPTPKKRNRNRMGLALQLNTGAGAQAPDSVPIVPTPNRSSLTLPKIDDLEFANSSQRARYEDFILQKESFINAKTTTAADFNKVRSLGAGQGGVVNLEEHIPTGLSMARKLIHIDIKPEVKKQIERELKIMHDCNSPNIVGFYGSFIEESEINILMEHMDVGSLDSVLGRVNRIHESVCGVIGKKVIEGLHYLLKEFKIVHRDVKPSNILINSAGEVKICDFGVSGQLEESLLMTFVGTRSYMAPERLEGSGTSGSGDVWSLGLCMIECMIGVFPIPPPNPPITTLPPILKNPPKTGRQTSIKSKPMSIFETLAAVVEGAAPQLPESLGFSTEVQDFVSKCCEKDTTVRAGLDTLLVHPWIGQCE